MAAYRTEIELKAKYRFDLTQERLVYVAMLIKEKRAVGHMGPGLDTVANADCRSRRSAASNNLTPERVAQAKAAADETAEHSELCRRLGPVSIPARPPLVFDQRRQAKLTVLRLFDRGELVAQCNISLLPAAEEKPVSLAEFQQRRAKVAGQELRPVHQRLRSRPTKPATHVLARGGPWRGRRFADRMGLLPGQDPQGKRVSLAFTYEQSLGERFAQADRALVGHCG